MEPDKIEKGEFNVEDILLPKKEGRTSASAERTSAGVLLTSEQEATLPRQPAPAPIQPAPKPQGPTNATPISPLQTYQSDVERVISTQNISAVSIAAAEAERAGRGGTLSSLTKKVKTNWESIQKITLMVGGVVLILGAASFLGYAFLRPTPSIPAQITSQTPFISVDDTQILLVTPEQFDRNTVMQNLQAIKDKTSVQLGMMSRAYVVVSTSTIKDTVPPAINAQSLLALIAPNISPEFLRTIEKDYYLLGTHVFDGNQEFLILKVDSYEQGFSGMLDWERTMQAELSPLFTRTPRPRIGTEAVSSTTAAALLQTTFRDKIVENHDARVVMNEAGDIILLWAFLDRNTLVITNNESTLREIISRRSSFVPGK